jgi:hypothetical protein
LSYLSFVLLTRCFSRSYCKCFCLETTYLTSEENKCQLRRFLRSYFPEFQRCLFLKSNASENLGNVSCTSMYCVVQMVIRNPDDDKVKNLFRQYKRLVGFILAKLIFRKILERNSISIAKDLKYKTGVVKASTWIISCLQICLFIYIKEMCAIKSVVIDLVKICLNEIFVRKIATRGVMRRRIV